MQRLVIYVAVKLKGYCMGKAMYKMGLLWGIWAITLLPCHDIFAQGQAEVLWLHRLTVEENLTSQNYNFYLFKDSRGFVWISSINGLNRYDGHGVKQYLHQDSTLHSLADNNVHSMFFEDRSGNLWFSTNDAIHCYDRKSDSFQRHYLEGVNPKQQNEYQVLHLDTLKEELWVRMEDELFIYPIDPSRQQTDLGNFNLNRRCRIIKDQYSQEHLLIIPDSTGVEIWNFRDYRKGQYFDYNLDDAFPGIQVSFAYFESEEQLWIGSNLGLILLNLKSNTTQLFSLNNRQSPLEVIDIISGGGDRLIVATRKEGIFFFDKKTHAFTHQLYSGEEGRIIPFLNPIYSIYLDADTTLWISSSGRGVYFANLKKRRFNSILQNHSPDPNQFHHVISMAQDTLGQIWCLTRNGIIVIDQEGRQLPAFKKFFGRGVAFTESEPYHIFCDHQNRIWVSTRLGLYVLANPAENFQKVPNHPEMKLPGFTFVYQMEENERLLASSQSMGVLEILEQNGNFRIDRPQELSHTGGTYTLIEENGGYVFFCKYSTAIDINHLNGEKLVLDTTILLKPPVHGIIKDQKESKFWVGTTQGLYNLKEEAGSFSLVYDTLFPSLPVNGLLQDEAGRLWASTNQGLLRYNPVTKETRTYGLSDGLQALEFNFLSYLETSTGSFAFGGVNGINLFDPMEIQDLHTQANPAITDILINDMPLPGLPCHETGATNISQIKKLRLTYQQNTLSFQFAPLEYSDPSANQFAYQMKGVDDSLVNHGTKSFTRYPNLPPGDYTFEVRATNSEGIWSSHYASLDVRILPPWWKTWWAKGLAGLLLVAFLYGGYLFRIRQIRKKEEFLRKEAEYQQQIAEIETSVLRLQMNPHFIFNSMNSISSYILKRDVDTANDYLGRFAKLMRMILKFAEQPFIDISTEIELLEQYLDTERMRFQKEFSYEFKVEEGMDPDDIVLPTMILQPFVENAIWHGLAQKEGKGHIRIAFQTENGKLLCSVEDNGVGRKAAQQQSVKAKQHESKALSITARRLKLLEEKEGAPASYKIVDLVDDQGRPAGTKVVLQMPVLL